VREPGPRLFYATAYSATEHNKGYASRNLSPSPSPTRWTCLSTKTRASATVWNQTRTATGDPARPCALLWTWPSPPPPSRTRPPMEPHLPETDLRRRAADRGRSTTGRSHPSTASAARTTPPKRLIPSPQGRHSTGQLVRSEHLTKSGRILTLPVSGLETGMRPGQLEALASYSADALNLIRSSFENKRSPHRQTQHRGCRLFSFPPGGRCHAVGKHVGQNQKAGRFVRPSKRPARPAERSTSDLHRTAA
jgi:hypothetical protein